MKQTAMNPYLPLTDAYQRRIDYLRISVTDRCNLKCVYCMPGKGLKPFRQADLLSVRELERIVLAAHRYGLRKVRVTGGEPLMRGDICTIISTIKKKTSIRDLSMTTNGIMLAPLAEKLKKAGLDRVNISLDTMDPGRYRTMTRGGDLSRVWDSIEAAEKSGLLPIKLNVIPIRGMNDDEIESFARLTFDRDCHIRFIEYMPTGRNAWKRELCVSMEETRARVSALGALEPLEFRGNGPSRNYRIKGSRGVVGFISAISDHFCGWCNRIRLTSTGLLLPCLYSSVKVDVKTPLRSGATDEELGRLIGCAVAAKPGGHALDRRKDGVRGDMTMSQIGG